ncbi:PREDICTED: neuropilin-1-like [Branchiostoma belcheri]|uniref:Neuropilin-1-like n=1 Tax=Branchiostoma belcheri TaxID=7741 RepID=A0A6P5AQG2_BRABE|nr:PREDICTED: neuropilin-1-like [Branchiostoma belcheri]
MAARTLLVVLALVVICKQGQGSTIPTASAEVAVPDDCSNPLGMESGDIPNDHITASTEDVGYEAWRGRLNNTNKAWQTNTVDTDQWLQIDLGGQKVITGVQTQGLWGGHTKSYKLLYSDDQQTWKVYGDDGGQIFTGNTDGPTVVEQTLPTPVRTRYIRINPQTWQGNTYIRLRTEILGCDVPAADYCSPNPCDHGTCVAESGGYNCTCEDGWEGVNCNNNTDDCSPDPCTHGTCTDGVASYICSCQNGWEGDNCDQSE